MKIFTLVLVVILLAACSRPSNSGKVAHRYVLSGKIISLDKAHQSATIDAAAIPNYMEAMTMEYPIRSKGDFASLHVGEEITGTLDVMDDDRYAISNIRPRSPGK
ncbi:MAG: copper-binding protein [Acidobacteriota bacterium]|nr:copper-binding protein [Acidobacteriota bacterium]